MANTRTRGNVPMAALKWTIERASREFSVSAVALRKFLRQSGCEPDESGCYSTRQLVECLFGDLRAQRVLKERALVRKYELANQITEGSVLDRAELTRTFTAIADAISTRIMSSELSRTAKEDILRDLSGWPLALEEVADRQTKLVRRRNGQDDDGDED